ncbi:hypothetical protein [Pseudanabaena sp. FACHB-2040]|uniref:hypothetical protein n=1 Tax=Pseudanabaena sp. FACHB-2040 TaxID=2692859 RepID=UPI00168300DC|nr:hypothetical protein [Pseudanabaena sp. FACHB-2040]MBD2261126.1 hypothetical protein [Pseudanabaena sp. FACHB-2040]
MALTPRVEPSPRLHPQQPLETRFGTMHPKRKSFAPITEEHELDLMPAAEKLWRELIRRLPAGSEQEIWLDKIELKHHQKAYSLRQKRRALDQLVEYELVEICRAYPGKRAYRVIAWHPGRRTWPEFQGKDKKVPEGTEKSAAGQESPENSPQTLEPPSSYTEKNSEKNLEKTTENSSSEKSEPVVVSEDFDFSTPSVPETSTGDTVSRHDSTAVLSPGYVDDQSNQSLSTAEDLAREKPFRGRQAKQAHHFEDIKHQLQQFEVTDPTLLEALSRLRAFKLKELDECLKGLKPQDKRQVQSAAFATAEAIAEGRVQYPADFLKKAIEVGFTPNTPPPPKKDEWWCLASQQEKFLHYGRIVNGEHMVAADPDHWGKRSKLEHLLPLSLLQSLKPSEVVAMRELFQHLLRNDLEAVESNVFVRSGRVKFVREDWNNS